jgi:hypothetical protein
MQAGSAFANQAAANQQQRAQAAAMSAERSRQRVLDDESRAVNQQALTRFEDVPEQQNRQSAELAQVFSGEPNRGADIISAALPQTSSNLTIQNDARERDEASAFAGQQGEAVARMRSFSDLFGGLDRATARDGSQIGMLGGFKRGSQGALPFELEAAAQQGQGMRGLADALGLFGGVGVNAGLSGRSLFPGRATAAPPVTTPRLYGGGR